VFSTTELVDIRQQSSDCRLRSRHLLKAARRLCVKSDVLIAFGRAAQRHKALIGDYRRKAGATTLR